MCRARVLSLVRLRGRLVPSCGIKEVRPVVVACRSTIGGRFGCAGFESIVKIGRVKVVPLLRLKCSWSQSGSQSIEARMRLLLSDIRRHWKLRCVAEVVEGARQGSRTRHQLGIEWVIKVKSVP